MTSIIHTGMICVTLLIVAFLVLLSLPKSQLRFFLLEILGWSGMVLGGLYILSPIDLLPDFLPVIGWIDDGFALLGTIAAIVAAVSARSGRQRLVAEQTRPDASRALIQTTNTKKAWDD